MSDSTLISNFLEDNGVTVCDTYNEDEAQILRDKLKLSYKSGRITGREPTTIQKARMITAAQDKLNTLMNPITKNTHKK